MYVFYLTKYQLPLVDFVVKIIASILLKIK